MISGWNLLQYSPGCWGLGGIDKTRMVWGVKC